MSKPVAKITVEFEHEGKPMRAVYECATLPDIEMDAGVRDYIQDVHDPVEVRGCRWIVSGGSIKITASLPTRNNFAEIEERIRSLTRTTDS